MRKLLKIPAILALPLVLIGCQSPEDVEKQAIEAAKVRCEGFGVEPSSKKFGECVQAERQKISAEDEERRMRLAAFGAAMQQAGQAMQNPPVAANNRSSNMPMPLTCNTYDRGVYTQTRCW